MSERNYSTLTYLQHIEEQLQPELGFQAKTADEWRAWRDALRERLRQQLGVMPEQRLALNPECLERVEEEGYTREKWVIDTEPDVSMPAYVYIPNDMKAGERRPGILALHGHGRGKVDIAGIVSSAAEYQQRVRQLNYDYARQYAKRGYVVIAPDARGFGERAPQGDTCTWMFTAALLLGKTLVGMRVWDAMRAIDYLQSRAEVDPDRIGCVGLSWGGTHTIYTTALDERIKVAVVSGYFSTFRDVLIDRGCCPCQYVPALRRYADLPDLVGLIAPRPLLIENGIQDPLYTLEVVQEAYPRVKRIYEVAGVPERVDIDFFEGAHRWSGAKAYDWIARWL